MRRKKIYYLHEVGQLGNQLSVLAHLIAFAETYNYDIIYPNVSGLRNSLKPPILKKLKFSNLLGHKYFAYTASKIAKGISFNKNKVLGGVQFVNNEFVAEQNTSPDKLPSVFIVTNWLFRFYSGVKEEHAFIREHLSFKPSFFSAPEKLIAGIKQKFDTQIIIGVHVRRGDYAQWKNGIYYYEPELYYSKMVEVSRLFPNCAFAICSNENIVFDNSNKLSIEYVKGSAIEDLCLLSMCSYIIGPPSTFSGWSAFLGHKPIYFIENPKDQITLDKFSYNFL